MIIKIKRLIITIVYLKIKQIYYRLYYVLRKQIRRKIGHTYDFHVRAKTFSINLKPSIYSTTTFDGNSFYFLNKKYYYRGSINWNYDEYGKLWTYNLTYFDYLEQENISQEIAINLMYNFIDNIDTVKDGLEPFPISLRGINWIKYITANKLDDKKINDSLYMQYMILIDNIEYHLLGNHLLENAFSLLFGAYYFQDDLFYTKAKEILKEELKEQILKDGAHFELSPMYHQIMLFRILDCINLVQNNSWKEKELLLLLQEKAAIMLGWIEMMTFENGDIPLLNDSTNGIAPTSKVLLEYANSLDIKMKQQCLSESGYRKYSYDKYECVIDIGNIGPDYIPGHAHADMFNFVLYVEGQPLIVDTGLSTYEANDRRLLERSTYAHNTVEIESKSQSHVWGAFRVAERAHIVSLHEYNNEIKAVHDGYEKNLGALHERTFIFKKNSIVIIDNILSMKSYKALARLHFHPSVDEDMIHKYINLTDLNYSMKEYLYAPEFNKNIKAKVLEISIDKKLEIRITL